MGLTGKQLEVVNNAFEVLKQGGVIVYPTDTIWGLGCDVSSLDGISRLYELKGRDKNKPFLILVDSLEMLSDYVAYIPQSALSLLHSVRKPLTIIYPRAQNLEPQLTANDGSIGIRIVKHSFCNPLLKMLDGALVSTSANFSGSPAPARFEDIDPALKAKVDFIVDPDLFSSGTSFSSALYKIINETKIECLRE